MIYVDASVFLAHILREPERPSDAFWEGTLVTSRLTQYEVWGRIHSGKLASSHGAIAGALLERALLLDLSPKILARALEPFPVTVKTADALHLATLDYMANASGVCRLATYDEHMAKIATRMGLKLHALSKDAF